jgi:murein DD-endopeptidase MepM/ murein hydrolase activator NlpD
VRRSLILTTLLLTGCLTPTGRQQPADVVTYGQRGGAGSSGIHTIFEGDTVYAIAQRYRLPMREIIAINNLSAPYALEIGDRLKLPAPKEYMVQPGDTLNRISKMFDVSLSETAKLNNLSAPYTIEKAQVLRLPSHQPKLEEEFAQNPAPPSSITAAELEQTSLPVKIGAVESEVLDPSSPPGTQKTAATTSTGDGSFPPQPSTSGAKVVAPDAKTETASATTASAATKPSAVLKVPARSGSGKFMRPVDGKIISKYGPKDGGLHNDGVNIKAARGTAVRAAENGVVAYTGNELQGYGNLVLIRHADRWMTAYAHLEKTLVKKGDTVKAGQSIGTVGASGQVDSPQLHFEIRRGTQALNPELYL